MREWLIKLLGGIVDEKPVSELTPIVDSAPADVPAPVTDFDKVKSVLVLIDAGIDEAYDDALAIAQKVGGDVQGKLKVFLNVAGYAVPAFDDIVAFIKKHG